LNSEFFLSAGSDRTIRYWDLNSPVSKSYQVNSPYLSEENKAVYSCENPDQEREIVIEK